MHTQTYAFTRTNTLGALGTEACLTHPVCKNLSWTLKKVTASSYPKTAGTFSLPPSLPFTHSVSLFLPLNLRPEKTD